MNYRKILYFDRGAETISALVSASIRQNENRRFEVSNFQSDLDLSPVEKIIAIEELIDRARAYPDCGT